MKWIKVSEKDPPAKVHFRDADTKHPITFGEAATRVDKNNIEWLDESTPDKETKESSVEIIKGDRWYWCKCESCGWENSSEYADGGTPIADTGDYTDPACPVCGSTGLDGDSEYVLDESYEKQIVSIPLNDFLAPYKKIVNEYHKQTWELHEKGLKIKELDTMREELDAKYKKCLATIRKFDSTLIEIFKL